MDSISQDIADVRHTLEAHMEAPTLEDLRSVFSAIVNLHSLLTEEDIQPQDRDLILNLRVSFTREL